MPFWSRNLFSCKQRGSKRKDNQDMERKDLPVGVFDSGVGGISVLRAMTALLPGEDFYFYGDSANAPYGTKSADLVRELTLEKVRYLRKRGIKAVVIACNTATSAAITALREEYDDMPVIGIEPALKPAINLGEHPRILVLATPGTVAGEKYRQLQERFLDQAQIIPLGCPGLMEYVENGILDGPYLEAYLRDLLSDVLADGPPDGVVLGCTHYPFVKDSIAAVVGKQVPLLDGSEGTARELKRRLELSGLLRERNEGGRVFFEMSDPGKTELAQRLYDAKNSR